MNNIDSIKEEISKADILNFNRSFEISNTSSKLLSKTDTIKEGRELIIRILDAWDKFNPVVYELLNDIVEMAGLYPYLEGNLLSGSSLLRHEYHKSGFLDSIYYHEEQMDVSLKLHASKSVIISAPTSYGKSLLIEEMVSSGKYDNIVIIQPTLALLDETRKKLNKYNKNYKIIVSTSQRPSEGPNIFLLTAERLVEYRDLPEIDFFVIDEFYKLSMSRDDERASVLNLAFYKLLKMTPLFYLLGPNIESIPENFAEEYNAEFIKSGFSTVAVDIFNMGDFKKTENDAKEAKLFKLLTELKESTLIYCSAPGKAKNLMKKFVEHCKENRFFPEKMHESKELDIIEWIEKNVSPDWCLKEAICYSAAMHHGALPRHINSSIVDYFNQRKITYLFCTSTLIEGVNTAAKNVILFDKTKGPKKLDYFDFKNIVGRSGRMNEHFIGRVFKFFPEPDLKLIQVDIPFYTQAAAESELIIQLDAEDVKNKDNDAYKLIESLDPDVQELIKKNKGMPMEGQLALIEKISKDITYFHPLLCWESFPKYLQLKTVIELAWDNLLKRGESKGGVLSAKQLTFMTSKYNETRSIKGFINSQLNSDYFDDVDEAIGISLQIIRHWFGYKLPKLLKTVSEIQKFVFSKYDLKAGNYDYYAALIENSFLPNNVALLIEYGIPATAINKLKDEIDSDIEVDEILDEVKKVDLIKAGLIDYEINKFKQIF